MYLYSNSCSLCPLCSFFIELNRGSISCTHGVLRSTPYIDIDGKTQFGSMEPLFQEANNVKATLLGEIKVKNAFKIKLNLLHKLHRHRVLVTVAHLFVLPCTRFLLQSDRWRYLHHLRELRPIHFRRRNPGILSVFTN